MERKQLVWYSVFASTGMLVLVLPAFIGLKSMAFSVVGMFLFLIAGRIGNPHTGNERLRLDRTAIAKLATVMAFIIGTIWFMRTDFGQTHVVGVSQVMMGVIACLWCGFLGYRWGKFVAGNGHGGA